MEQAWKDTSGATACALIAVALTGGCSSSTADGRPRADARGSVVYVDGRAEPGGDGRTWATALRFATDALSLATPGDTIRVAQGSYRPDQSAENPGGSLDRTMTFQLRSGIRLSGGFAGFGEGDPDAVDVAAWPTILTGDLAGDDGDEFTNREDNSLHVVTGSSSDATAVLDGFTVSGGNANGPNPYPEADTVGGGLLNWHGGSPTVTRCTFRSSSAEHAGGAIANGFGSSPAISECTFIDNRTVAEILDLDPQRLDSGGGAIVNVEASSPTIAASTFVGNTAFGGGAILAEIGAAPRIVGCSFENNTTTNANGGGVYSRKQASMYVRDCTFRDNSAAHVGGALSFRETPADIWVLNSVFQGNRAHDGGGAVRVGNGSSVHIVNCTFVGNSATEPSAAVPEPAGGVDLGSDGEVDLRTSTVENSIFWGNTAAGEPRQLALSGVYPAGLFVRYSDVEGGVSAVPVASSSFALTWDEGNLDADPLFTDAAAGDLHLSVTSPCLGAGDPEALPSDVTTDLSGNPRVTEGQVDMGAYQRSP